MNNAHNEQKARGLLDNHIKGNKTFWFIVWIAGVVISALVMVIPVM